MSEAQNSKEFILVPVSELKKLEQARELLYSRLSCLLSEEDIAEITEITQQIWNVANTKNWYWYKFQYCENSGQIETDNNGQIGDCQVCGGCGKARTG